MPIRFNATIDAFIPGNFVSWRIIKIPGEKTPVIEKDYDLTNIEVVTEALEMDVQDHGIAYMPTISNSKNLNNAVFEIEKTTRKKFRVVRYVGTLKVEYKIEPGANMTPRNTPGQDIQATEIPDPEEYEF
jgi:hypothetical protein